MWASLPQRCHPWCRFILFEAEEKGLELPYACRLGCCTACAVKVKEGEMWQPHALGISRELKEQVHHILDIPPSLHPSLPLGSSQCTPWAGLVCKH